LESQFASPGRLSVFLRSIAWRPPALKLLLACSLDIAIALNACSLLAVVTTGGFDLGWLRASSAAKPLLFLTLLLPLRVAVGVPRLFSQAVAAVRTMGGRVGAGYAVPAAVQDAALAFLAARLGTLAIALVANVLLLRDRARPFAVDLPWARLTEAWTVFDSAWYIDIARRGYFFDPNAQSSVAFFPLYPMLIRLVALPFGGSEEALWFAGMAISWASFFAALVALHRLTERLTGSRPAARRAVLYIAVFPFSFYFGQVYSEATFLLWTVLAVSAAHDGRWAGAGLYGSLAVATRVNGVLIALPLVLMAVQDRPSLRELARRTAWLVPMPLTIAAFTGYTYLLTGRPLAWLDAQAQWGFSVGHMPYAHLLRTAQSIEAQGFYTWLVGSETAPIDFAYTTIALLFLALVPALARRFGAPMTAYVIAALLLPLSANVLVGFGRYASVLFPVFILASEWRAPGVQQGILVVSSLFYTLFLILFIGWYPLH
jgi:hypothetical protein